MRTQQQPEWTAVILDAQALSLWMDEDRRMQARLSLLMEQGTPLIVCANTIIELARHPSHRRIDWVLSRTRVEPVTQLLARTAAVLLRNVGMSGHVNAIDASVAAVALHQSGTSAIMTSDPDDMNRLCQGRVGILLA